MVLIVCGSFALSFSHQDVEGELARYVPFGLAVARSDRSNESDRKTARRRQLTTNTKSKSSTTKQLSAAHPQYLHHGILRVSTHY